MSKKAVVFGLAAVLLGLAVGTYAEQDPTLVPGPQSEVVSSPEGTAEEADAQRGAFGLGSQDTWVGATQFVPRFGGGLTYESFYYWTCSDTSAEAQVLLPAGAQVTIIECFFNDTNASSNGNVVFSRHGYNYSTDDPSAFTITSVASAGSSGYQKPYQVINETIKYRDGDLRNIYTLTYYEPNANISFRGCRLFWNRQVSPPPASATFSDVPTSNPQFKFVEALVAAGITGGCGTNTYCPESPVTRGQMAVFLSAALGLHWPY